MCRICTIEERLIHLEDDLEARNILDEELEELLEEKESLEKELKNLW